MLHKAFMYCPGNAYSNWRITLPRNLPHFYHLPSFQQYVIALSPFALFLWVSALFKKQKQKATELCYFNGALEGETSACINWASSMI